MASWPSELAGMVVHYGTGAAQMPDEPFEPFTPGVSLPDLSEPADIVKYLTAPASIEPKTVEQAAKALADAMAEESAVANRHREALAKAEARYKSELGHVARLAEKHIEARERTAAARAKVVELAKGEP